MTDESVIEKHDWFNHIIGIVLVSLVDSAIAEYVSKE